MDKCKDCDITLKRVQRRPEKINKKGRWYWKSYLYCVLCKKRYFVESEKILVRAKRLYSKKPTKKSKRVERY